MINVISFLFAIGVGFGLSFWICGSILEKSNNIGDSKGDRADYQAYVNFTSREDRISNSERQTYSSKHSQPIEGATQGPSGSERVRRLSDEEIANTMQLPKKKLKLRLRRPYQGPLPDSTTPKTSSRDGRVSSIRMIPAEFSSRLAETSNSRPGRRVQHFVQLFER